MAKKQKSSFFRPEERRTFEKGKVELVTLGGTTFGRLTLEPGWRWSTCLKPVAGAETSPSAPLLCHVAARLRVAMEDGSEEEFEPGDVALLPAGHDAWVVGNEAVVIVAITGMENYGRKKEPGFPESPLLD
jgi:hypothetical protein